MTIQTTPITVTATTIQYCLWFVFFYKLLTPRMKKSLFILCVVLLYIPYFAVCTVYPHIRAAHIIPPAIVLFIELLVLFKESVKQKFLALMCILLPVALSEIFLAATMIRTHALAVGFASYYSLSQQAAIASIYIIVQIVLLIVFYSLWKTLQGSGAYSLPASSWLAFMFFPCSQYIVIAEWFIRDKDGIDPQERVFLLICLLIYSIADVALLCIIYGNIKRVKLEERNETLSCLINMQAEYYPALAEHYEDMRKLRHDLANHMYTVKVLLDADDYDSARSYAEELSKTDAYSSSLGSCKNHIIDSFLYQRIKKLKESGIEVTAHISLPESCSIANTELISVFGNMLDNAEEACRLTDDKFIDLICSVRRGYITITTSNPSLPATGEPKARRIPELERGLGSQILKDIANKYEGNFVAAFKDGMYTASLTMKEGNTDDKNSGL